MKPKLRMSHSRVELYNTCGAKYKFKYLDKLEPDKTYTPLLYGAAIDEALNYLLICMRDKKNIDIVESKRIFNQKMDTWKGERELVYFKYEVPADLYDENDPVSNQYNAFLNLKKVGELMIDTYAAEILPLFEEIVDVQITKVVENEVGDEFILIMDFIAKLKTGETVVIDNKTSGDVKKSYPKTAVVNSQQLALYAEYTESNKAAYIALSKKPKDGKIEWKLVLDTIPEENIAKAYDKLDEAMRGIKREEFHKNEKGCWSFGARCSYWDYCKNGSKKGLIQK